MWGRWLNGRAQDLKAAVLGEVNGLVVVGRLRSRTAIGVGERTKELNETDDERITCQCGK